MNRSPDRPISRRSFAQLGAASLVGATSAANGESRPATVNPSKSMIDVTAAPYRAVADGVRDDAPAIQRAVAALPASGGTVLLPGPGQYVVGRTIEDDGKSVHFQIGHAQVIGPAIGPIFNLTSNGSMVTGAGVGVSVLRISRQATAPHAPRFALSLQDGAIVAAKTLEPGAGLRTTPLLEIEDSTTADGAAIIASVASGALTRADLVAMGRGYVVPPGVEMLGGGECAIRIDDASHCRIADLTIDLMNIPHAVGIFQHGGWYIDICRVDVSANSLHPTGIALVIDSHSLGQPGRNGTYGGAYLGRYVQLVAKRLYVVGHDTSTASTLHFDTLDTAHLHIHSAIAITMTNGVLQAGTGTFFDLVNVDGLSMVGGDVEGGATLVRTRGVCNNVRLAPLAYSATGEIQRGPIGTGWRLDLAKSNSAEGVLVSGNGGSATVVYQNSGWIEKHRAGMQYGGDSVVYSSNIRLTGPHMGLLDNPANPGFAMIMTISGQLILRHAIPGAGPVVLEDVLMIDDAGVEIRNLPSTRPPAGAKRLWFDPSDGFRVKFQP